MVWLGRASARGKLVIQSCLPLNFPLQYLNQTNDNKKYKENKTNMYVLLPLNE